MILSKTDQFLFLRMGMMLFASGKNKDKLIASIGELRRLLSNAKPVKGQQNYVFVLPSTKLHTTIHAVFNNIFVGCDRTWRVMSAEAKFSLIISTIWNKCFNSLWKLSMAAKNENVRKDDEMLSEVVAVADLPVGVREYEDLALKSLARSITNCLESKRKPTQQTEPSTELVKVTPYHVQETNGSLRRSLETKEREIQQLQLKLVDEKNNASELLDRYEKTMRNRTAGLVSCFKDLEDLNKSLRTQNLTLTNTIAKVSSNIELDTLLPSGEFGDAPPGVIAVKNSVNRLIMQLKENKASIQKKLSNVNAANVQPVDGGEADEFFQKFEQKAKTDIDNIIVRLASMEALGESMARDLTRQTSST